MPIKKRVKSFFLPVNGFVPDEQKVGAIGLADDSVELPSDRILGEIRGRQVQRGQFGIGSIFLIVTVISLVCAAPNLFDWDVPRYWSTISVLTWIFTPGWIYLSCWAINAYQFSPAFNGVTCLFAVMIGGVSVYFFGTEVLYLALTWVLQIPVLVWLHFLFKNGSKKSQSKNDSLARNGGFVI